MARKAIESVDTSKETKAKAGKQDIKALPPVFENEEQFRAYIALASILADEEKADSYNANLTDNKLLTVKQSVENYKAAGIELEKEFYPVSVNMAGLFCGIYRRQRVIFAVAFVGNDKFAFTVSTRANKPLPELEGQADNYGYAAKYLSRLDSNNGVLLPATVDFNHFVENNFGLPFCYSTAAADLLDFNQWTSGGKIDKFAEFKKTAAAFEEVKYDDNEDCIADFCKVAKNNGFAVYRQDVMKVAIDYAAYLKGVIAGENFSAIQKAKAIKMLKLKTSTNENKETQKEVKTA